MLARSDDLGTVRDRRHVVVALDHRVQARDVDPPAARVGEQDRRQLRAPRRRRCRRSRSPRSPSGQRLDRGERVVVVEARTAPSGAARARARARRRPPSSGAWTGDDRRAVLGRDRLRALERGRRAISANSGSEGISATIRPVPALDQVRDPHLAHDRLAEHERRHVLQRLRAIASRPSVPFSRSVATRAGGSSSPGAISADGPHAVTRAREARARRRRGSKCTSGV